MILARTGFMQRTGDQFFTGAGFARNQHGGIGWGNLGDVGEDCA